MDMLHAEPALFTGLVFLFGLLVGSFLNVVIHRLPKMMEAEWRTQCAELHGELLPEVPRYNLWLPRSACTQCGHQITALENIPLISWLWLRARCSACSTPISARYPLVELLTALLSAAVAWKWGASVQTAGALLLVWVLIALAFIDLDTTLLPDSLTLPLVWLGLLFNLNGAFASLPDAVVGAKAGYGVLSSVCCAAAGSAMVVLAKHDRRVPIPFGPYLAGGGLVALFFGADLTQAYLAQF